MPVLKCPDIRENLLVDTHFDKDIDADRILVTTQAIHMFFPSG